MSSRSSRKGSAKAKSAAATKAKAKSRTGGSGPIVFFVALFIVALGTIQLLSTFYTYALDLSELNGLKRQEAALVEKKQELENDIARWNDDSYVAAQARERLGFVFPGEQVVQVLHPEAVTGERQSDETNRSSAEEKVLPWYSELAYSIEQADNREQSDNDSGTAGKTTTGGDGNGTNDDTNGDAGTTGTDDTEDTQQ